MINKERARRIAEARKSYDERYRKQVTTLILEHPEEFVDAMMSALEKKYSIREEGGRKSGRY